MNYFTKVIEQFKQPSNYVACAIGIIIGVII